jgi:hypothetical protein
MIKHYPLNIKLADTGLYTRLIIDREAHLFDFSEAILLAIYKALDINCEEAKWQVLNQRIDNQGHFILPDAQKEATWYWQNTQQTFGRLEVSTDDLGTYDGGIIFFWYLYVLNIPNFTGFLTVNSYGSEPMYLKVEDEHSQEIAHTIVEVTEKVLRNK